MRLYVLDAVRQIIFSATALREAAVECLACAVTTAMKWVTCRVIAPLRPNLDLIPTLAGWKHTPTSYAVITGAQRIIMCYIWTLVIVEYNLAIGKVCLDSDFGNLRFCEVSNWSLTANGSFGCIFVNLREQREQQDWAAFTREFIMWCIRQSNKMCRLMEVKWVDFCSALLCAKSIGRISEALWYFLTIKTSTSCYFTAMCCWLVRVANPR